MFLEHISENGQTKHKKVIVIVATFVYLYKERVRVGDELLHGDGHMSYSYYETII